jgi:aminoglycoside phosphotransferase family enzyme
MATLAGEREPELAEKVRFLSDGAALGEPGVPVERLETHFAWVFLTRRFAYKLRKPICYHGLDTRSLDARRARCEDELKVNEALAPGVYLGVVPLTRGSSGFSLGGSGETADWLLRMRRLPAERMFDTMLRDRSWRPADLEALEARLRAFFAAAPVVRISGATYCNRLRAAIAYNHQELLAGQAQGTDAAQVVEVVALQNRLLESHRVALARRAEDGWIRDCHGDLRPEHICLEPPVRIIDRLECEREGARWAGAGLMRRYLAASGAGVPPSMVDFYLSNRALTRARLAAWRLIELDGDPRLLRAKGRDYVERALEAAQRAAHSISSRRVSEP